MQATLSASGFSSTCQHSATQHGTACATLIVKTMASAEQRDDGGRCCHLHCAFRHAHTDTVIPAIEDMTSTLWRVRSLKPKKKTHTHTQQQRIGCCVCGAARSNTVALHDMLRFVVARCFAFFFCVVTSTNARFDLGLLPSRTAAHATEAAASGHCWSVGVALRAVAVFLVLANLFFLSARVASALLVGRKEAAAFAQGGLSRWLLAAERRTPDGARHSWRRRSTSGRQLIVAQQQRLVALAKCVGALPFPVTHR